MTLHSYGRRVVSFLFSWCSTGGLGAHSAGWSATSYQQLLRSPNSIGVPEGPPRPGVAFPTTSLLHWNSNSTGSSNSTAKCPCHCQLPQLPSWLRYIIVQRLHGRPLDLWNRMFNRHQAEITVMQFTGHSLPVHQSMSVSWALPCPISSANFRPRDFLS